MIIKSLIILSMLLNSIGLHGVADKFDEAVVRDRSGAIKEAVAGSNALSLPEILPRPKVRANSRLFNIYAKHYILADLDSGVILAKESAREQVPIASTTKIMTAVIVLENYKLDDIITISSSAENQIGAEVYLKAGEKITVENVLKCLLINSGNDAAYALAEHMNGKSETGIDKFVAKMNAKAKELGMDDTHYEDPAGLNTTGYSSAFDLYLVTKYALRYDHFRSIVKQEGDSVKSVDGQTWHQLKNSNRLVTEYKYPGAIGVKTGYMPEAGHCLVAAAKRENHTLISVVLNTYADTATASADESRKLLDWGFQNVEWE